MSRDLSSLAGHYDLAVIGGGIVGAASAYEAARRGLKVLLLEQDDFGGATSAGCFKTVHGGLRYLQSADLPRILESAGEQRTLRRLAPHLVSPLPFLVPCSGWGMRSRLALDVAARVYEAIAWRRNFGVIEEACLPKHKVVSASELKAIAPNLPQPTTGGVIFYDALMYSPERLTWAFVAGAKALGAEVHNYVRVTGFELAQSPEATWGEAHGRRNITKLKALDRETNTEYHVAADCVINAAGPWIKQVEKLASNQPQPTMKFSKGIQAIVPKLFDGPALAVESKFAGDGAVVARGNRSYFLIPWRSWSLIGTADALHTGSPDGYSLTEEELRGLVGEVSAAIGNPNLKPESVVHAFGGLRPIDRRFAGKFADVDYYFGTVEPAHDDEIVDYGATTVRAGAEMPKNLISVEAIKYSTARRIAERAVRMAHAKLNRPWKEPELERLPGGQFVSVGALIQDARSLFGSSISSADTITHLARQYGSAVTEIAALVRESPTLGRAVGPSGTLAAEIVYCLRNEMVARLPDLLLRRTAAGTAGCPTNGELQETIELAAPELGWDSARKEQEAAKIKLCYPLESFSWRRR